MVPLSEVEIVMMKGSAVASEVTEVSEVALTFLPEEEVIDHPSRDLEADSRALPEAVSSEVDSEAAKAPGSTIERTERNFPEEVVSMRKIEVNSSKDLSEAVAASEAVTSLREAPAECMVAEALIAVVALRVKKIEAVPVEVVPVLAPSLASFKLLQEAEGNLLTTEEARSMNDI